MRSEAITQHVVKEEIVEFVWAYKIFGFLSYCTVGSCRSQFRADGSIGYIGKQLTHSSGIDRCKIPYQVLDKCFGHAGIHGVHAHVVAVICCPSQCQLREVAGTQHHSAKAVGKIHQNLCSLACLTVFVGYIGNLRVLADIGEMLAYRFHYRDFP